MIDINELRRLAQAALPGPDGVSLNWLKLLQDFQKEANPATVIELLDRLEAAEKDIALKERIIDSLGSELNAVANERDALRAKIEAMERQTPVAKVRVHQIEAGGYRDIGTDLTDDALAAIHMLGIIKTYGKKEPQK